MTHSVVDTATSAEHHVTHPISIVFWNETGSIKGDFELLLPATLEEAQAVFNKGQVKKWGDIGLAGAFADQKFGEGLVGVTTDFADRFSDTLNEIIKGELTPKVLNELNLLASNLRELKPNHGGLEIFAANVVSGNNCAILEAGWHCGSVAEIVNLTFNLDCFETAPAYDLEQLGHLYSAEASEEFWRAGNGASEALQLHIARLESCVNAEEYGKRVFDDLGGAFTDAGFIAHRHPIKTIYRGVQDIPQEHHESTRLHDASHTPHTPHTPQSTQPTQSAEQRPSVLAQIADARQAQKNQPATPITPLVADKRRNNPER